MAATAENPSLSELPAGRAPWQRRDWLVMAGLVLAAWITRVPFWPRLVVHPDGAGYVWSLDHFDLMAHHPHPPGCLPFVLCGKALHALGLAPHLSLLIVSTGFGALACAALYALGTALFGGRVGLAAALLLLFDNNSWFGGLLPMPHTAAIFWAVATIGAAYAARLGGRKWLWISAVCLGLGAGFRADVGIAVAVAWLWTLRRVGLPRLLGAVVLAGLLAAAWGPLTGLMTGGYAVYRTANLIHWRENFYPASILPMLHHPRALVEYLQTSLTRWFAFYLGAGSHLSVLAWLAPAVYAWGRALRVNVLARDYRAQLLVLWLVPLALFHLLIFMGARLYGVGYAAPFMLLGGLGAYFFSRDWGAIAPRRRAPRTPQSRADRALVVVLLLACLLNIGVFLATSVRGLRADTRSLAARVAYINGQPVGTAVLVQSDLQGDDHCVFYYTQRFPQYDAFQTMTGGAPSALAPPSPVRLGPGVREVIFLNPAARVAGPAQVVKVGGGAALKVRPLAAEERYMFFGPAGVAFGAGPS